MNRAIVKDHIQVYCRIRPMQDENEVECLKMVSPSTIQMLTPETAVNFRDGCYKETQYTFSGVFNEDTTQNSIFEHVGLPLVDSLLRGKNGLLFTYGITGSGKTFTMTGTPQDNGIMPRALDVIFNSIMNVQAKKFIFKPDRLNGFEIQSEEEAKKDGLIEIHAQAQTPKFPRVFRRPGGDWTSRLPENTKVECINEDNIHAVFVTYVEIYNNHAFDLLDENFEDNSLKYRTPQSKLVREDAAKNMYVHGVNEVEVKSSEEAFDVFNKGMRRKRMAHNRLNTESSRSHSVFTVRLVQAPVDHYREAILQDRKNISISQLSFVDLAGSERTNRTNTSGQRLREAGNINNSLMTLRTCLSILRDNQMYATNKIVPYRDSKLTHLFKNFFERECTIRVIICVNPRANDYDENIHVMKFAEMSQEVQLTKSTPVHNIDNLPSGRRKANQIFKRANKNTDTENIQIDVGESAVYSLASHFPDMCLTKPEDQRLLQNLMKFLEVEVAKRKKFEVEVQLKGQEFRELLLRNEREIRQLRQDNGMLIQQNTSLSNDLHGYKEKIFNWESQLIKAEVEAGSLKRQLVGYERVINRLQEELQDKEDALNKRLQDREKDKQRFKSKIAQTTEKMSQQMEMKLSGHKRKFEMEIRRKDKKLQQVKRILSNDMLESPPLSSMVPSSYDLLSKSTESLLTPSTSTTPSNFTIRKKLKVNYNTPMSYRTPAVSNPRHRRSRSVSDDLWLEHRPQAPVPLNTVMQPVFKKHKSITKLTDMKVVANSKTSKYCLLTQEQDSEGDMETHIYKGDVVPTCGGGAQVILNDVEILKQKSPTSPTRKRCGNLLTPNVEDKCSISVEGHSNTKRSKR